ncbi:endonuclease domain-containing protein [Aestuariimicrobium soli]|uniref:endonuclease domain-containing protein n=1 Tax=Aestuariimicrobium soli TaxID=2035834 RepID=UPI003EBE6B88
MHSTGVLTLADLHPLGLSRQEIRGQVRAGRLRRIRSGWFARPDADPAAVRAVAAGGAVTCVSALRLAKAAGSSGWASTVWVAPHQGLHVRLPSNSRRLTAHPEGLVMHQLGRTAGVPTRAIDPLSAAVAAASTCLPAAEWVAVVDSLLHAGYPADDLLSDAIAVWPYRENHLVTLMKRTNTLSESGSESLLRHDLQRAGFRVRVQVLIGPDRVDLLVGDRLVIECDSVAHHTSLDNYFRDRRRDQRLSRLNYHVLRVTYQEVLNERPRLVELVRELARQGVHTWGRVHRGSAA